ncbi:MAG: hypothetical protein SPLUMA2_SPLUMAMAG2_01791 [uncultured Sulfurimonas sp.]|nr:MAG: hypothetical protein SPLUMA2_SPLUMAMAG2_01791 [uncultured Sulfurimonas sp.]
MSECYLVESDNKYHFVTTSLKQLFLQMLFNYLFVNQDDHARNFSFMCSDDYKW